MELLGDAGTTLVTIIFYTTEMKILPKSRMRITFKGLINIRNTNIKYI